ncbi:MAG TPA: Gfo/Idh/MocA family oxidoreductase [Vicinamibacterales bacterium]|nr:Gfo/Idh/MocA family oxidoreductase [Vicinamibacterales bacterium]
MNQLRQSWPAPAAPRPIAIVGAGAIVRTAHLPAYRRLQFAIAGLFDICRATAEQTAARFGGLPVFPTLAEACAVDGAVFDVAVPGTEIAGVLAQLPRGAAVLIQKPMGENLATARTILDLCRERQLIAAMNFQLRFSPNVLALADLVAAGRLGDLTDIEVRVVDRQPWEQWTFLEGAPRLEVLYHSIHYLDAIRWIAGEPDGVMCRAISHPQLTGFSDSRSTIVIDYGDRIRCSLVLNHTHAQDRRHRASMLKIEGTKGAALATLGVNLDYPSGPPDRLEIALGGAWQDVPLRGSWFTEAFEGPMSNLQRVVAGEDIALVSPVDDAIRTMALVEACYASSAAGSTPIPAA